MREAASVAGPKPLFYKWKPQRQLSLRWFTVWPRSAVAEEASSPPRECGFSQLRRNKTNKHKQTERKRDRRFEQREESSARRRKDTAESFQSCHSGESRRPDNAHKWRISGQPWKHMCRKVKEVEQRRKFGTCSSCVVVGTAGLFDLLYSGVTGLWQTCEHRRGLRGCEAERLRGWGWTGPSGLGESVRKGTCHGAKNNSTKCWNISQKTSEAHRPGQLESQNHFQSFFFFVFFFVLQMDRVDQTKTISRGEFFKARIDDEPDSKWSWCGELHPPAGLSWLQSQ